MDGNRKDIAVNNKPSERTNVRRNVYQFNFFAIRVGSLRMKILTENPAVYI